MSLSEINCKPAASLPDKVRQLALHLGAEPVCRHGSVTLRQKGRLRTKERSRWMSFSASQEISLQEPTFCWRAKVGPFGAIRVVDALHHGTPAGSVSLFDKVRLAESTPSPALLKGELMRYLAELAWAPDAIFANRLLRWEILESDRIAVSASVGAVSGRVVATLDERGGIGQIDADDRPRMEGDDFIERGWSGRFGDYRPVSGRLIPHHAEVSWRINGIFEPVWIGKLTSWTLE